MSAIDIVEAVATVFWVYAALGALEWTARLVRTDRRQHVPLVADLISHLVPAMAGLIAVVVAGAMLGFPTVVVIIAILFPAGLAFGVQMALNELREAEWRAELTRLAVVLLLAGIVIYIRQIA